MGPAGGTKVGSVFIDVNANADNFRIGMERAKAEAVRAGTAMTGAMKKTEAAANSLHGSFSNLHTILGLIGGVALAKEVVNIADKFSLMRSRIRLVTQAGEDMYAIEEKLAQQAMINRADLKETVGLYTRLRQSREDLSDAVTQNLVDKWSKSLIISASSAQEAAASTQQFAQAMAAGTLQGQELRSVIQGNSAFAVYLAKGLGITTGELKKMGEEGKITVDAINAALEKSGGAIEHDFAKKALTVHQALTNIETATIRLVGITDQTFGISGGIATWVNMLSGALGDLTLAMQGPVKQAEDALTKMRAANAAVAADVPHLKQLHEELADAIRSQGVAAEETKRIELAAVTSRIAKNKELADTYRLIAQAKLAEAEGQLRQRDEWLKGNKFADQTNEAWLHHQLGRIKVKQDADIPLRNGEIALLQDEAKWKLLRADVEQLRKTISDIDKGIGTLPEEPKTEDPPKLPPPPGLPPTAKTIQELTGYYTQLEQLERSLADIRMAEAEGATGASRAAVQAMLDYLDATGDVVTVLEKMKALSGNIISPEDVSLIDGFVAAAQLSTRMNALGNQAFDLSGVNEIGGQAPPREPTFSEQTWSTYEQRVADATKQGLLNGVETGDWGEAFGQVLRDVTRDALSNAIDVLLNAISEINWTGKDGGTGWGGFFNAVGSFAGWKPMASGGPVSAGSMYRVGELGSEWFVPQTNGFIMPNGAVPAGELGRSNSITVGGAVINIQGDASEATARIIAESMDRFGRALPSLIDARVQDRQKRGAY